MKINKTLKIILIILLFSNVLLAQDIHLSQFYMTPTLIEPSQTGNFNGDIRAIINHRSQWKSVMVNPFTTYGFAYDMQFKKNKTNNFFGGGLNVFTDKAGEVSLKTTLVDLSIAYHVRINNNSYLSAGIQGGLLQRSVNIDNMRFDNQFDGTGHNPSYYSGETFNTFGLYKPDVSAGVSYLWSNSSNSNVISNNGYNGIKINAGLAVHHVSRPGYSFITSNNDKLANKYIGYINTSVGIENTSVAIQPSALFSYQSKANDMLLGGFIRYTLKEQSKYTGFVHGSAISFGGHYRMKDSFIMELLVETGSFAFCLSYDINTSSLAIASNSRGGFEISIRYITPNPFGGSRSRSRFN